MRFPSSALIPFLSAALAVGPSTLFAQSGPKVYVKDGHCASTEPVDLALPDLLPGRYYSVLATLTDVRASNDSKLRVELFDPTGMPTGKVLHQGDPDLQFTFRPRIAGVSVLRIARSTERGPVVKAIDDATRPVARDRKAIALVQDDANLVDAMREGDLGCLAGASPPLPLLGRHELRRSGPRSPSARASPHTALAMSLVRG